MSGGRDVILLKSPVESVISGKERRTRLLLFPFLNKLVLALTTSSNLPSSVDRSFYLEIERNFCTLPTSSEMK